MTTLTNTDTNEFRRELDSFSEAAKKVGGSLSMGHITQLSEKYLDVPFVIYFSYDGEKCRGIKNYSDLSAARFYANKPNVNGRIFLAGKEL